MRPAGFKRVWGGGAERSVGLSFPTPWRTGALLVSAMYVSSLCSSGSWRWGWAGREAGLSPFTSGYTGVYTICNVSGGGDVAYVLRGDVIPSRSLNHSSARTYKENAGSLRAASVISRLFAAEIRQPWVCARARGGSPFPPGPLVDSGFTYTHLREIYCYGKLEITTFINGYILFFVTLTLYYSSPDSSPHLWTVSGEW